MIKTRQQVDPLVDVTVKMIDLRHQFENLISADKGSTMLCITISSEHVITRLDYAKNGQTLIRETIEAYKCQPSQ